jgi:hypothetical protein
MRFVRRNRALAGYRGWQISRWGLALCLIAPTAPAAENAQDEELSLSFLEFLGEWEDEQGNWQDPLEYENPEHAPGASAPGANVEQNDETH